MLVWFLTPIIVFGVFPIVDTLIGHDKRNPPESETARLESVRYYRWITYAYIPLQYLSLALACSMWASGDLTWWQSLGLSTSVGLVGGIAINTAHELGHKRPALERWLSKVALAQTAYGHFQLEHNRGHHAKVSTPEDPASARLGEHFYEFLPRTVLGSLRSAVRLERERRGAAGSALLGSAQRAAQRLGHDGRAVRGPGGVVRTVGAAVAPAAGRPRLLAAGGGQLHRALRVAPPAPGRRSLRALPARALLEREQRRVQPPAVPAPAPQRSPRLPDPPLPGATSPRGRAAAPDGVRRDDRARRHPADLAAGHGPRVIEHYGGDVTRANVHPRRRARLLAAHGTAARERRRSDRATALRRGLRALLRQSILQAADRLLREASWGAVTMAQVAEGAGVSRQTVYNEFGNRADLARAYALWAADELLDDVERSVASHRDDLRAALVSTFATLLAIGHEHPLIQALGDDEGSAELAAALVSGTRSPLVVVASDRLAEIIGRAWPDLPAAPVASTSEVLVRLAISHLLHPSSTPEDAAAQVAEVLGPFLAMLER